MILRFQILTLLTLYVATRIATGSSYSGYSVYRCMPKTEEQVAQLVEIYKERNGSEIDFWSTKFNVDGQVDIMLSPKVKDKFLARLKESGLEPMKTIGDVGKLVKQNKPKIKSNRILNNPSQMADILNPNVFHTKFHRYAIIEAKLRKLKESFSEMHSLEEIGKTHERKPIYLAKISRDPSAKRKVIMIDAGTHAREWAGISTILYVMEYLLANNGSFSELLNNYDFWFVPVVNPDGYEYSHITDRVWRKNRSMSNSSCGGVDLNRNYPNSWRTISECDELDYAGPRAASELEVQAMLKILNNEDRRIVFYSSLHSYGGAILTPYAYKVAYPENYPDLKRVAEAAIETIMDLKGPKYIVGPASVVLYAVGGGSDDQAYAGGNIKLSYTIELESENESFIMPSDNIIPMGYRMARALAAMVSAIKSA